MSDDGDQRDLSLHAAEYGLRVAETYLNAPWMNSAARDRYREIKFAAVERLDASEYGGRGNILAAFKAAFYAQVKSPDTTFEPVLRHE